MAFPTDTLYGLAADPASASAVEKVLAIKGRAPGAALPLVAADLDQVRMAGRLSPLAERLAARFWPGPLAILIDAAETLAEGVRAPDGSVAVRVPAHAVARALARAAGTPLTATSANRSGAAPAADARAALAALGAEVDAIVDAGPARGGAPSTIVDARGAAPRLVREGAIAWTRVLESLR